MSDDEFGIYVPDQGNNNTGIQRQTNRIMETNRADEIRRPREPEEQRSYEQYGENMMTTVKTKMGDFMNWIQTNKSLLIKIVIAVLVLIALIIIIKSITNKSENFIYETPNGPMSQDISVVPGKGAVQTTRYGVQEYVEEIHPSGIDMRQLTQDDATVSAIRSGQQADVMLKKEMYNGMKQMDDPEIQGNIQESGELQLIHQQINDLQIEKNVNLTNTKMINDLDVIKQTIVARQIPLQDVNELEQTNRDAQVNRDHEALVRATYGAGIFVAPPDQNEIIKSRQRYAVNSNRPQKYKEPVEKIKEQIEYQVKFDNEKEAKIKLSGPDVKLPDMKSTEQNMNTTSVTQEPVVQLDKQKVILDQQVIETPDVKGTVVVEKTVNPEIIMKVEEKYGRWPFQISTKQQKEAAGKFMTILVLLKYSGQEIPSLKVLMEKFPELQKLKSGGVFSKMDGSIIKWANQSIESVRKGDHGLDNIISQFKLVYGFDPIQNVVAGKQQQNGEIKKETVRLESTISNNSDKEGFVSKTGKHKFIMKKETYTIRPGFGIRGKSTSKSTYIY